jgi:hypothetical protein
MGNSADREVAMSKLDKEISTEAYWQVHYILWSIIMGIPDLCGGNRGYERIVARYIKFLQYGVNYTNKDGLRAATLVGYTKAITNLFTLRGFPALVDPSDPNNMGEIITTNHAREEDIAIQGYPLNLEILANQCTMATHLALKTPSKTCFSTSPALVVSLDQK